MPQTYALGWHRDLPDFRDFVIDSGEVKSILDGFKALRASTAPAASVDWSSYCSPIENQGNLGSCTANAGVGLLEYFERRAFNQFTDASRLFLYKVTRRLLGWTGDTGAYLRTTMKAMVVFGSPPENYWPYDPAKFDDEPSGFLYAFAQNYKSIVYYRHDQRGMTGTNVLDRVKAYLAAGHPSMFGFTVYNYGNANGEFAYPGPNDRAIGGHAVVAIGYDDARRIGNCVGALKIRNSWGTGWGQNGYGWLPYDYVKNQLAVDFWSLTKASYVKTGNF